MLLDIYQEVKACSADLNIFCFEPSVYYVPAAQATAAASLCQATRGSTILEMLVFLAL